MSRLLQYELENAKSYYAARKAEQRTDAIATMLLYRIKIEIEELERQYARQARPQGHELSSTYSISRGIRKTMRKLWYYTYRSFFKIFKMDQKVSRQEEIFSR